MFLDIFVRFWHFVDHQRKKRAQHWGNYTCVKSLQFFKMSQECYMVLPSPIIVGLAKRASLAYSVHGTVRVKWFCVHRTTGSTNLISTHMKYVRVKQSKHVTVYPFKYLVDSVTGWIKLATWRLYTVAFPWLSIHTHCDIRSSPLPAFPNMPWCIQFRKYAHTSCPCIFHQWHDIFRCVYL